MMLGLLPAAALAGCHFSESGPRYQTGLEGLELVRVDPGVVVPGTTLVAEGASFVDQTLGRSELVLDGTFTPAGGGGAASVTVHASARFADFEHLEVDVDADFARQMGGADGGFHGTATVAVDSTVDGQLHQSRAVPVDLTLASRLTPRLDAVAPPDQVFVNDALEVTGDGLLLGGGGDGTGGEGVTYAELRGCYARRDQAGALGPCLPVGPVDAPVTAASRFDRTRGSFALPPGLIGIHAGHFDGQITLRNVPAGSSDDTRSAPQEGHYDVSQARVTGVSPDAVSLGQYLEVAGGGFVGGADGQVTLLHVVGQFVSDGGDGGAADPVDIDTVLVPEFERGRAVRYVINEDDDLGRAINLRSGTGTLSGQVTPIVSLDTDEVTGDPVPVSLRFAAVRQVVYLEFTPQYVTSLQHFGLRAADAAIRQRIVDVVARAYRTVNVDVRTEVPDDFSLYAVVEIGGPDPNGLGLLGYDNTPGKDVNNIRLYDQIGGVNAQTQADGYPGYGGVFVDSMFLFSMHPGDFAPDGTGSQDAAFDQIFDPFRPDQDGQPVSPDEVTGGVPVRGSGAGCPAAGDRSQQIGCAVWVLGSLIGSTVAHELGHSLGLADPYGPNIHILTDKPDRLMEAGTGRPFRERAELDGQGPGVFCDTEYSYLRSILPTADPDDPTPRPDCL